MTTFPPAIAKVHGHAVVLRGADIDTDRIMPARYLKAVTFEGLEQHLFADDRAADRRQGIAHPLDGPGAAGATILLAQSNFGCGSSREHAPQALRRWGFQAIIAESFSPIFSGNALSIGLVCVSVARDVMAALMAACDEAPTVEIHVDLKAQTVTAASHGTRLTRPLVIPDAQRQAWLSGQWDATGLLLANYAEVERVDARLPYLRAISRNA